MRKFNPDIHHRCSIRLKGYDYSTPGAYFITICAKERELLFGDVTKGIMNENRIGELVKRIWFDVPMRFKMIEMDAYVVMPNHIHGIIVIHETYNKRNNDTCDILTVTLGEIIRAYKSLTATGVNKLLDRIGQPFWQRNYYERIIRNEDELNHTREYIINNPPDWESDEYYSQ